MYFSGSFRKYFPKLDRYYRSTLGMVSPMVFDGSPPSRHVPFASFTLNVGDQCICRAHLDGCNLAGGLCLVSPFGEFDYTQGGHLILHELKLVLEVPSGAIILFPSAIITHENLPIGNRETRQSITAFSPGTLFQWIDNGLQPASRKCRGHGFKRYRPKVSRRVQSEKNVWARMVRRFPHIRTWF